MYQKPAPCTEQTRTYSTGAAFLVGRSAALAAVAMAANATTDDASMLFETVILRASRRGPDSAQREVILAGRMKARFSLYN
jgi:hypothetical protein